MSYSRGREFRRGIYEQNTKLCKSLAVPRSTLFYSYGVKGMPKKEFDTKTVKFYDVTSEQGAIQANADGYENVVVMNFASNRHAGGGYVRGASAQEEDCCRCFPTLYESLNNTKVKVKGVERSAYIFDKRNVILTPDVKLMRDSEKHYDLIDNKDQFGVYFASAAAPNLKFETFNAETVKEAFKTTLLAPIKLFNLSETKKNAIVLGAWGCGAFRNNPKTMAPIMRDLISEYGGYYDAIYFAIPDKDGSNYKGFYDAFN